MRDTMATVGETAAGEPITRGQRAAFDRDGYLVVPAVLDPDQVARYASIVDRLYQGHRQAGLLDAGGGLHKLRPVLARGHLPRPGHRRQRAGPGHRPADRHRPWGSHHGSEPAGRGYDDHRRAASQPGRMTEPVEGARACPLGSPGAWWLS
jgi:hypothetical protein